MKKVLIVIISVLIILIPLTISIYYGSVPYIKLNGSKNQKIVLNKEYKELGVSAKNLFGKNDYNIEIKGKVNTKKVVSYNYADIGINLIRPVGGRITSRFGTRSSGMHRGLDIAAPTGTPIYAAAAGTVVSSGWSDNGFGYCILISHGNGVQTLYAHCSDLYVSAGEYVSQGEHIAAVGSTGWSTGPHLHLEIRVNGSVVNPQYYLY